MTEDWKTAGRLYEDSDGRLRVWTIVGCQRTETPGLVVTGARPPFAVTHVATGMAVAFFPTADNATRAAKALGSVADWEREQPVDQAAARETVYPIIEAFDGQRSTRKTST